MRKLQINEQQKVALSAYAGGEFADLTTVEELLSCGDSLFVFLMTELSDKEDCEDFSTACQRVEAAIYELNGVLSALEPRCYEGEKT